MKNIRNIAAIAILSLFFAACGANSEQKSIGGSADTSNVSEGSNAGNETTGSDTTQTMPDSTHNAEGNAKPDGRPQQ
jgi:hypothetical protein